MKVAYLVHNIDDAAVLKRIAFLRLGGADVRLAGFQRYDDGQSPSARFAPVNLGQTRDGQFLKRVLKVVGFVGRPGVLKDWITSSDVILCRNLEMLLLGYALKWKLGAKATLCYECLDIHRLLLGSSVKSLLLRGLEGLLLRRTYALITSSPAFVTNYFHSLQKFKGKICLIENKVLDDRGVLPKQNALASPPWVIGWFGIIRCRKSLEFLRELVVANPMLRVVISGRVAEQEFDDFARRVASTPRMTFTGPFKAEELAAVYGQAHFVWAIDYFEEGENSAWLLPNRLYDSLAFGSIPVALGSVETGRWLKARHAGVVVESPVRDLGAFFTKLTLDDYEQLRCDAKRIEPGDYVHTAPSAKQLVSALA